MKPVLRKLADLLYSLSGEKKKPADEYSETARRIFGQIEKEFESAQSQKDITELYPKFVVSVEFFRYLRGEFFHASRPTEGRCQKELYEMEHSLENRLTMLGSKINREDSRTQFILDESKKLFA